MRGVKEDCPSNQKFTLLPKQPDERKAVPIGTGVLDYFPLALAEIARVSKAGNDQHNPGQPLHWNRGKSKDHWDCIIRHGLERGMIDTDGQLHTAKLAWRALALLQEELETQGAILRTDGNKEVR
jgi:hypothetical protein